MIYLLIQDSIYRNGLKNKDTQNHWDTTRNTQGKSKEMKEVIIAMVLMFGATASVFAFLGNGENRNIGLNNGQCPKGNYVCGITWND
jgi:hypothetical protein